MPDATEVEKQLPPSLGALNPELLIYRITESEAGKRIPVTEALTVARCFKDSVNCHSNDQASDTVWPILTGHTEWGGRREDTHAAYYALPASGRRSLTSDIMGVAVALPRSMPEAARAEAEGIIDHSAKHRLVMGKVGAVFLERVTEGFGVPFFLRKRFWTASSSGAKRWGTVTPLVLDRHPKANNRDKWMEEADDLVRACVEGMGFPRPRSVFITPGSPQQSIPDIDAFPKYLRKDGSGVAHVHAVICFDHPVIGPVSAGSGRYAGYGLFRPLDKLC
jgi:CRISPR-associated protein Csb2